MILVTPDLRERLLVNGRRSGLDHVPVVKFINPLGIGTWLATELDQDDDSCSVSPISATPRLDRSASRRWRRCPCRSAWLSNATFCSRACSRSPSMPRLRDRPAASCAVNAYCARPRRLCKESGDALSSLATADAVRGQHAQA